MQFLKQIINQNESYNKIKDEEKLWSEHLNSQKNSNNSPGTLRTFEKF